jgi:hypothetical protein
MNKVLFILKRREDFDSTKHTLMGLTTGLYNSANFMNEMLQKNGVESHLVVVIDNNDIDREVTKYKPTHVIIEALWVVPSKFNILHKLHPNVKWIVRIHSEMPFMAGEGIAMDWIADYAAFPNIVLGINSPRMMEQIKFYLNLKQPGLDSKVTYLPNYYLQDGYKLAKIIDPDKDTIDVSCFGAVRLLKNHLIQVFAALQLADYLGKKLHFHINAERMEMSGQPVVSNIKHLFQQLHGTGHQLIIHPWAEREQFLETCRSCDIGMQVSFTETFNIVYADSVTQGVPVVGSSEIPWAALEFCANPNNSNDIFDKLLTAYNNGNLNVKWHQERLNTYSEETKRIWLEYFRGE